MYGLEQNLGSLISTRSPFMQLGEGGRITYLKVCYIFEYEHTVTQNITNPDIIMLSVVVKIHYRDYQKRYLQFCTVDCTPAYNYIMNKRSSRFAKFDLKGSVMFSVVLHKLCKARFG